MANRRYKPIEIVQKLRQAGVLVVQEPETIATMAQRPTMH